MGEFAVILVHTTTRAIQVDRVLRRAGLAVRLIPTPRYLSSDCGAAVRIEAVRQAEAERLLREAGLTFERIALLAE